jgi:hypothetical protein
VRAELLRALAELEVSEEDLRRLEEDQAEADDGDDE